MPYDLSDWPSVADLTARLTEMGQDATAYSDASKQNAIDSVVAILIQRTKRQFVPSAEPETRYFDGTGTGEIEVDPFRSVSSVGIVGYLGTISSSLTNIQGFTTYGLPQTRIDIFRGSLPSMGRIWVDSFPEGRGNVAVTALWGYGDTIPADVWNAVLETAAQMLARRTSYSASGPLSSWKEGDISESFAAYTIEQLAQYPALDAVVRLYSKTTGSRLRNRARRMV